MTTLGIDLGTTHAVAAQNGRVLPLRGLEAFVLPSVVAFPPNGETWVGSQARERRAIDAKNTLRSTKRIIGEPWLSERVGRYRERYVCELVRLDGSEVAFRTRAGLVTPEAVATLIVATLVHRVQVLPEQADVVITVPAAFGSPHREATVRALAPIAFRSLRIIEEPIASALAYLQRSNMRYGAVYDFGGGTFDVAILDCSAAPFRVVGHAGDPFLGGDDIDERLARWLAQHVLREHGWDLTDNAEIFDRLLLAAESAKHRLSTATATTVSISEADPAAPEDLGEIRVTRADLEALSQDLIARSLAICDEASARAGLGRDRIDAVFLAGGTTYLPFVRQAVAAHFERRPRADLDPMHVVSIGASLAATRPAMDDLLVHVSSDT